MAGEQLRLDAARARASGQDLSAAGSQLVGVSNGAVAEIAAASTGRPWGRDDIGAAFHQQYGPMVQLFVEAFGRVAGYVEEIGAVAVRTVTDNEAADARASATVDTSYRT